MPIIDGFSLELMTLAIAFANFFMCIAFKKVLITWAIGNQSWKLNLFALHL